MCCMCAWPRSVLVAADYSQIEMRILAHVCQDKQLLSLFSRSGDVYRLMAALIGHKPAEAVTDDERTRAKVICLGERIAACKRYTVLYCVVLYCIELSCTVLNLASFLLMC